MSVFKATLTTTPYYKQQPLQETESGCLLETCIRKIIATIADCFKIIFSYFFASQESASLKGRVATQHSFQKPADCAVINLRKSLSSPEETHKILKQLDQFRDKGSFPTLSDETIREHLIWALNHAEPSLYNDIALSLDHLVFTEMKTLYEQGINDQMVKPPYLDSLIKLLKQDPVKHAALIRQFQSAAFAIEPPPSDELQEIATMPDYWKVVSEGYAYNSPGLTYQLSYLYEKNKTSSFYGGFLLHVVLRSEDPDRLSTIKLFINNGADPKHLFLGTHSLLDSAERLNKHGNNDCIIQYIKSL